ncbi:MAG: hypothetical protein WEC15_02170 [Flavobacteriales bacterium]
MASKKLSDKEIAQLLGQYRSERRRLMFQLDTIRSAMRELKSGLSDSPAPAVGDAPVKRGPGRPRKTDAEKALTRKKPGRRKKRTISGGGYRLNEWDKMILDTIGGRNQLLPKEELLAATLEWAKKNEPALSAEEVEAKLTRVLQKLSGRRGELGAHRTGLRRGYHYGLKEWFFASSGLLLKQHYDKLVLVAD